VQVPAPRPVESNPPPTPRPSERTYGMPYAEADRWGRLMLEAIGNRRLTHVLLWHRYVKDRAWKDGASRVKQEEAAKAFDVDVRTIKRWAADAEQLGFVQPAGWQATRYGRMGKWVALPLPERLPAAGVSHKRSDAKCHSNEVTAPNTTVVRARTASSSTVSPQRTETPIHLQEHPDVQGGSNSTNGSDQDPAGLDCDEDNSREETETINSALDDEKQRDEVPHPRKKRTSKSRGSELPDDGSHPELDALIAACRRGEISLDAARWQVTAIRWKHAPTLEQMQKAWDEISTIAANPTPEPAELPEVA
jgi:hypothetical protein